MSVPIIVLLSILGYFVLAFLISYVQGLIMWFYCCSKARDQTEPIIDSLGPAVVFSGLQGSGKSTCGAGAATMQSKLFLERALNRIQEIRCIFYKIDFSELDGMIQFAFEHKRYNTDFIVISIFTASENYRKAFGSGSVDDGVNHVSKLELFRDYIDASIAVLKSNPVYFINSQFYNHYTKKYALELTHGSTSIRDRYLSKDWSIYRYSVIFEDEVLIGSGNNQNRDQEAASDPGVDAFLQLIRHIGKGNLKYFMVAQDFERLNKARRELVNSIVDMKGFKNIKTKPLAIWFWSVILGIVKYLDRFIKDSTPKAFYEKHWKEVNFFRTTIAKISMKIRHLEGYSYIRYAATIYTSAKDYRKSPDQMTSVAINCHLFYPAVWCWGSINTHEYSSVYDVLSFESRDSKVVSNIDPVPSPAVREEYAKQILRKRGTVSAEKSRPTTSEVDIVL